MDFLFDSVERLLFLTGKTSAASGKLNELYQGAVPRKSKINYYIIKGNNFIKAQQPEHYYSLVLNIMNKNSSNSAKEQ